MKIVKAWNRFFFEPISPATIGLFRIAIGMVALLSTLGRYPYRDIFYGADAIVSYKSMSLLFTGNPLLYFRWVPLEEPWLQFYFLGILLACLSLILGFCTRLSSILVFLGLITLSNRNYFVDNAGDDLLRINCFYLMFSHAGAAYSLDRWISLKRGKITKQLKALSPWAQRLIQLQLAYLYLETAYLKLYGPSWVDGTALYYSLNYLELRRFDFRFLFSQLWAVKVATYATLTAEFLACSLMWFRKFRYPILVTAALLHLSINLLMQFPIFQYVMLASLVTFIYPEDIERILNKLKP